MKKNQYAEKYRMPVFSFFLGGFAIILSFLMVYIAYKNSIKKAEFNIYKFYQSKALFLNAIIEKNSDLSDAELLDYINNLYNSVEKLAGDEYVCIVDKKSDLILHTLHPGTVGNYAGRNTVFDDYKEQCTLSDLVDIEKNYLGHYISS